MVYNPVSGKDSERKDPDQIVSAFNRHGFEGTKTITACSGDATRLVKDNLDGQEAVICCGGDGTFRCYGNRRKEAHYVPSYGFNE